MRYMLHRIMKTIYCMCMRACVRVFATYIPTLMRIIMLETDVAGSRYRYIYDEKFNLKTLYNFLIGSVIPIHA